jgi:hypothetical protein
MTVDFLNEFEIRRLEELAQGEFPSSGWAKAILMLNKGASYGEAGRASGLTARQARYRRDKFLKQRLELFPGGASGDWVPASGSALHEGDDSAAVESRPDSGKKKKTAKAGKKDKKKKSKGTKKGKKKKKKKDKSKSGKKKKGKKKKK